MKIRIIALGAAMALGGCGGSGVTVPQQFVGTWGADCSSPFVTFADGSVKVFPDNATYKLKSAVAQGQTFQVTYDTPQGTLTDVYVSEGSTLRLDQTISGGQSATWHKAPMNKCS